MPYPARFYAALHRGTPGDQPHYQRLCDTATSVLELGCGYGRMLTALAAADRTIVGVEYEPDLLAMAEAAVDRLPPPLRAGVSLVQGDMRDVSLDRVFDRVLLPFGGLYCLLSDADLDATLANVVRHLAPGGRVGLDVYRADAFHAEAEPDDVPDDAHTPLTRVEVDGQPFEVLERSHWDKPAQRIDASYLYVGEDGASVEGTIAQRYLLEPQLRAAFGRAGLAIVDIRDRFGDPAPDERDGDDDAMMIVEARRDEVGG
ncbi:MAG: class I SAM-dependent methyltransferase [Deltaproteobacteria bacterium]|nr:class I SAM-dependent methyltransferase [Deltaproteobacteria bacterium]